MWTFEFFFQKLHPSNVIYPWYSVFLILNLFCHESQELFVTKSRRYQWMVQYRAVLQDVWFMLHACIYFQRPCNKWDNAYRGGQQVWMNIVIMACINPCGVTWCNQPEPPSILSTSVFMHKFLWYALWSTRNGPVMFWGPLEDVNISCTNFSISCWKHIHFCEMMHSACKIQYSKLEINWLLFPFLLTPYDNWKQEHILFIYWSNLLCYLDCKGGFTLGCPPLCPQVDESFDEVTRGKKRT